MIADYFFRHLSIHLGKLVHVMTLVGVVCAVVGVFFTYGQIRLAASSLAGSKNTQSAQFMFDLEEQLHSGTNLTILHAIDNDTLKVETTSTRDALDDYLMKYEMLENAYRHHLIDPEMFYDTFSYDLERAWCNKEVQKYIQQARRESGSPDLYGGIEDMARDVKVLCN